MIQISTRKKTLPKSKLGFHRPNIQKRLLSGVLVSAVAFVGMNAFVDRYTIMIDYTGYRCLDARVLLVDKNDKTHTAGDIVAIDGKGVPILPDDNRYVKLIAATEGETVSFDGQTVTSSSGFTRYAPLSIEYEEAKKKYNLGTEWTLDDNQIFLIGDTPHSLDGRVVGPSNADYIIGKAYVLF